MYDNDLTNKTITEKASTEAENGYSTGLIPVKPCDIIRVNAMGWATTSGVRFFKAVCDDYYTYSINKGNITEITNGGGKYTVTGEYVNGVLSDVEIHLNAETCGWLYSESNPFLYAWFWILSTTPPENVIITVNEEITYTVTEDRYIWEWVNTGEQYYAVDYLSMIKALEERVERLEAAL